MIPEKQQALMEKMTDLGYPEFEVMPEEGVEMLYIGGHLICSVDHALSLSDEGLKALIY